MSVKTWLLLAVGAVCANPLLLHSEIFVKPASDPAVGFAGKPASIEWRMENPAAESASEEFGFRVFQLTSASAAPLGPTQRWKRVVVAAGQRVIESLTVTLPEVRVVTTFRVEIVAPGVTPARQTIIACPSGLLREVLVQVSEPKLATVLERLGAKIAKGEGSDEAVVVLGPFLDGVPQRDTLAALLRDARSTQRGCVVLLPARELAGLASIAIPDERNGTKLILADMARTWPLENSAAAQLTFFRHLQLASGRETLPILDAFAP